MLNKRHGQAKILSSDEIELLLKIGFLCARDQTLFIFCFYTGCRISEALQMPVKNVFYKDDVLEEIVIPKEITKAQQGTRTIPTHPSLSKFLKNYHRESLQLLKLKEATGSWSHMSMRRDGKVRVIQHLKCPKCCSAHLNKCGTYTYKAKTKAGVTQGEQYYFCKECAHQFRESKAIRNEAVEESIAIYDCLGVTSSDNYGFLFADPNNPFLFPGKGGKGHLSLSTAESIFRSAFDRAGIIGASTHSCRRTALTRMHAAGVLLRVLQEISGHKDLGALQRYLEVTQEEISAAINFLG